MVWKLTCIHIFECPTGKYFQISHRGPQKHRAYTWTIPGSSSVFIICTAVKEAVVGEMKIVSPRLPPTMLIKYVWKKEKEAVNECDQGCSKCVFSFPPRFTINYCKHRNCIYVSQSICIEEWTRTERGKKGSGGSVGCEVRRYGVPGVALTFCPQRSVFCEEKLEMSVTLNDSNTVKRTLPYHCFPNKQIFWVIFGNESKDDLAWQGFPSAWHPNVYICTQQPLY